MRRKGGWEGKVGWRERKLEGRWEEGIDGRRGRREGGGITT